MKFGFIPTEGGHYYPEFLEEVLLGEKLGFDSVWLEEHHAVKNHYWPSPLIGLAGAATRTERMLLGTDIMVLPFYHPVRVAEDAAMLDIMSGGRFILGAAIGYKPDEFSLYQVPLEMRGARFAEAVQLIKKLWAEEEVTFDGKYYQVERLKIEPRPLNSGHLPLWIGGWGKLSLQRAGIYGDAWLPGPTADLEKLLSCRATYRQHLRERGIDPATMPNPLTRELVIAPTDAEAREMAERHLLINYRDEYAGGKWKHPFLGTEDKAAVDVLDAISRDRFLVGSPDTVCRQLQKFVDDYGMDHLIFRMYFPGMPHDFIMRELRLLAEEVMPAFR